MTERNVVAAYKVTLLCAALLLLVVAAVNLTATATPQQVPEKYAKYQQRQGFVPDVVLITKQTPDTWQLCAARPDGDMVDCRTVGDARKWLRERPAIKR